MSEVTTKNIFSRTTLISACNSLEPKSHAQIDNFFLEIRVHKFVFGDSKLRKINSLIEFIEENPNFDIETGQFSEVVFSDEIIKKIISKISCYQMSKDLENALSRDGFLLNQNHDGSLELQRMYPQIADLPKTDDEVHELLKKYSFNISLGHLEQAIEAHIQSNWASANAQFRTFMESLFDEFYEKLTSDKTSQIKGINARQKLTKLANPFLFEDLNEWTPDGKSYIEGLFKRLHREGSHPGLSDEEDSTFRLHIVLVTARLFLRRYEEGINKKSYSKKSGAEDIDFEW